MAKTLTITGFITIEALTNAYNQVHPGEETPYAVQGIEDFLGPANQVIAP